MAHQKRGTLAIDAMGVMAKMTGVACHDGWKPYRSYDVLHQLCNAHSAERAILRNWRARRDRGPGRAGFRIGVDLICSA